MKLTAEANREAVKRYRHIKRGRGRRCAIACPGTTLTCTRGRAHNGPHVAHGAFGKILAVWDSGSGAQLVTSSVPGSGAPRSVTTGRPIGLRTQSPTGALDKAWRLTVRLLSSWDQLVFVVLFLVFVKFAFDVLLSLY